MKGRRKIKGIKEKRNEHRLSSYVQGEREGGRDGGRDVGNCCRFSQRGREGKKENCEEEGRLEASVHV